MQRRRAGENSGKTGTLGRRGKEDGRAEGRNRKQEPGEDPGILGSSIIVPEEEKVYFILCYVECPETNNEGMQ